METMINEYSETEGRKIPSVSLKNKYNMIQLPLFDKPEQAYDNRGAYDTLMGMMRHQDKINVKFSANKKDMIPYAWVDSKNVAGFKYQLKSESIAGLIHYLETGEISDFDRDPCNVDKLSEEQVDFTELVLKQFIENGKIIQWTPMFRESPEYISGIHSCLRGKIFFRIHRSDSIIDYLREYKQAI
jgi:hypothetical protein